MWCFAIWCFYGLRLLYLGVWAWVDVVVGLVGFWCIWGYYGFDSLIFLVGSFMVLVGFYFGVFEVFGLTDFVG